MIAANWVGEAAQKNAGFGGDNNELIVLWQGGKKTFSLRPKEQLARDLLKLIKTHFPKLS